MVPRPAASRTAYVLEDDDKGTAVTTVASVCSGAACSIIDLRQPSSANRVRVCVFCAHAGQGEEACEGRGSEEVEECTALSFAVLSAREAEAGRGGVEVASCLLCRREEEDRRQKKLEPP